MLWVAVGRAGAVHRYRTDGKLDGVVELPTSNPTSVAFGGGDGGDLYIATSWVDCERPADEPLAGAIFRCRPGVTGQPSPRYREHPRRAEKGATPMIERMILFGASGDLTSRLLLPRSPCWPRGPPATSRCEEYAAGTAPPAPDAQHLSSAGPRHP